MITVITAAVVILVFLAPFLVEEDQSSTHRVACKKQLNKIALWSSVMLVSLYLVLTLVILLEISTVSISMHTNSTVHRFARLCRSNVDLH